MLSQSCQAYVNVLELSLHVPLVVLSARPCVVVPLTVGAMMLSGGTGSGGTGSDPPVVVEVVVVGDGVDAGESDGKCKEQ